MFLPMTICHFLLTLDDVCPILGHDIKVKYK